MRLEELINWLESQDKTAIITDGFGDPHCDRGSYMNLAFDPVEKTTIGQMLDHAKSALGKTFTGWKGGDFDMHEYTDVLIGEHGVCGEHINSANFKLWELQMKNNQT